MSNTISTTDEPPLRDMQLGTIYLALTQDFRRQAILAIAEIHEGRVSDDARAIHLNTVQRHMPGVRPTDDYTSGETLHEETLPFLDDSKLIEYEADNRTVEWYDAEKITLMANVNTMAESVLDTHEFAKQIGADEQADRDIHDVLTERAAVESYYYEDTGSDDIIVEFDPEATTEHRRDTMAAVSKVTDNVIEWESTDEPDQMVVRRE